jgi:hypothetical protein
LFAHIQVRVSRLVGVRRAVTVFAQRALAAGIDIPESSRNRDRLWMIVAVMAEGAVEIEVGIDMVVVAAFPIAAMSV